MHNIHDLPHRYTHCFIGLCPKGILINSIFCLPPKRQKKKKVWYFYNNKCHIVKYFPEQKDYSVSYAYNFTFLVIGRIFYKLGSGSPISNLVSPPLSTQFWSCVYDSG